MERNLYFAITLSFVFLPYFPSSAVSQHVLIINSIQIERVDVFEGNLGWFERTANELHTLTKERIIRRELLFHDADTVNEKLLEETERNLRRLGFIGDIKIVKVPLNDSLVDIHVTIQDRWTLNTNISLKREGGITNFSASISENNFAGFAQSVSIGYNNRSDRKYPHGFEFHFQEPRSFNSFWNSTIQYFDSEDSKLTTLLLEQPFYTETSNWSLGIYGDRGKERKQLYHEGILIADKFLDSEGEAFWGIYSFNNRSKFRIGGAIVRHKKEYDSLLFNPSDNISLVNISFGWLTRQYATITFVDNLGRIEDIPFGYSFSFVAGKDIVAYDLYYVQALSQYSKYSENIYWYTGLSFQGYTRTGNFEDAFASLTNTSFWKISPFYVLASRMTGVFGFPPRRGNQMYLDSRSGVRGIQVHLLQGNSMCVYNIEHRFATPLSWWIFDVGSVIFFDGGTIVNDNVNIFDQHFYKSIGVGLRILNQKQQGSGILRFDLAYNIDFRKVEFILSVNQLFNVIGNIESITPNSF